MALTSFIEEERVTAALEAGATGYLLKDADADDVAVAVRRAHAGEVHLDPQVARLLARRIRSRRDDAPAREPLTEREREVLALVAKGHANKEIAALLDITERTARTHVSNILGKLDLASRTQAALWAIEHRIAEPGHDVDPTATRGRRTSERPARRRRAARPWTRAGPDRCPGASCSSTARG